MNNNLPQIFEHDDFGTIRAIEKDGKPWFIGKDLAAALGYSDTAKAVRIHCKGVDEMATPSAGGIQTVKIIPEGDVFRLIMKSQLPSAEKFQDWVCDIVLPTLRKTGTFSMGSTDSSAYVTAKAHLDLELFVQEHLNASEASRLMIMHSVYKDHGVSTKYLPQYTEAVKITFSATDLLKKNECELKTIAFNQLLLANGYLEEKERTASRGKVKKFKILTDKGLKYGQNDIHPRSPRETQPHYFEENFMELYNKVTTPEMVTD